MAWKLVEVPDEDPEAMLDDSALIGTSICLAEYVRNSAAGADSVYYRAWKGIQVAVKKALDRED